MELGSADIQLLYGPVLWRLEADTLEEPMAEPEVTTMAEESAPSWKAPDGAILSMVLPEESLPQDQRQLLIDVLKAIGMSPMQAVLQSNHPSEAALNAAPTDIVLIFDIAYPLDEVTIADKEVYAIPSLEQMLQSKEAKMKAWETLKLFKDRI